MSERNCLCRSENTRKQFWICLAMFLLFAVWWAVPTYRKWQADKLVDELCAKDGGLKVYETVTLPATMFNKYGQPKIKFVGPSEGSESMSDVGLYFSSEQRNLVGDPNTNDINKLVVWQSKIRLHRRSDGKVLGEAILYARRGGDAIGPWHPSSYSCPSNTSEWDLANKVVMKKTFDNGGKP